MNTDKLTFAVMLLVLVTVAFGGIILAWIFRRRIQHFGKWVASKLPIPKWLTTLPKAILVAGGVIMGLFALWFFPKLTIIFVLVYLGRKLFKLFKVDRLKAHASSLNQGDVTILLALGMVLMVPFLFFPWYVAFFVDSLTVSLLLLGVTSFLYVAKKYHIFLFFPEQGRAYVVQRQGEFEKVIMSHEGYHLNDPRDPDMYDYYAHFHGTKDGIKDSADWYEWYIVPNRWERTLQDGSKKETTWTDPRPLILKKLGAHWLSIWPNVRVQPYEFTWKEWKSNEKGALVLRPRDEETNFVFVKTFPYAIKLEKAEVIGRIRVDITGTAQVRCCNPKTAIAKNEEWFLQLEGYILDQLRQFASKSTYESLTAAAEESKEAAEKEEQEDPISNLILKLNEDVPGLKHHAIAGSSEGTPVGIRRLLGIEIISIKIEQIELADNESKRIVDAMIAQTAEDKEGKARVTKAEYDAKAAVLKGKGEGDEAKERIDRTYQAIIKFGEVGVHLRQLEALEKSGAGDGNTVIWANNPLPVLTEAARQLLVRNTETGNQTEKGNE